MDEFHEWRITSQENFVEMSSLEDELSKTKGRLNIFRMNQKTAVECFCELAGCHCELVFPNERDVYKVTRSIQLLRKEYLDRTQGHQTQIERPIYSYFVAKLVAECYITLIVSQMLEHEHKNPQCTCSPQ